MMCHVHTSDIDLEAYTHLHTHNEMCDATNQAWHPCQHHIYALPHHCLPIDTWFDCPVQRPTCGCIAGVLCLAHCVRFIFCDPTDHPGIRTSSSSFRDLHDVFIDGPREKHISTPTPERCSRFRNLRALHQTSLCHISAGTCSSDSRPLQGSAADPAGLK